MLAVAERYLGSGRAGLRRLEAAELLETMDANGVERAILDFNLDRPSAHTLRVVEAAPERLALSGRVDPRGVMAPATSPPSISPSRSSPPTPAATPNASSSPSRSSLVCLWHTKGERPRLQGTSRRSQPL